MKSIVLDIIIAVAVTFLLGDSMGAVNTHPLVVATYFGSSYSDNMLPLTPSVIDAEGNIIFAIYTESPDLATAGAYDVSSNGGADILVVKMNPQLTSVLAATYLGGSGAEQAFCIGLDSDGHIYIGGNTHSPDFPVSTGAYDNVLAGDEGFVAIFSADLDSLIAATFIGGSGNDKTYDIAIALDGSVFALLRTFSTDLIATPGTIGPSFFGGDADFFIAHLNDSLSAVSAASYAGGNGYEVVAGLHLDANGDMYIAGSSTSTNLPTTPGAFAMSTPGNPEYIAGFIMHTDKDLDTVLACTYIGGNYMDFIYNFNLAANGDVYVTGHVMGGWPVTPGCFDPTFNGGTGDEGADSYVTRMSGDLTTLKASTFLGGAIWDFGSDILIDDNGFVYVVGETNSANFPASPDAYQGTKDDTTDMFFSIFDTTLSLLHMSTFIGGSGFEARPGILRDDDGILYVIGYTESSDLTTTAWAYDPSYNGAGDIYLIKFDFVHLPGDANGDGSVNVGDAVFLISYVFKGGSAPDPIETGDANCDGSTNVGDAVYLISYIFKGGAPPCA